MAWQVHRTKEHLERPGTWRSQRGNSGTILGNVQNPSNFPLSKSYSSQYLQYTEPQDHPLLADRHHYGWRFTVQDDSVWRVWDTTE